MANGKPTFNTDFSQMGWGQPTPQTSTGQVSPVWQTLLEGMPTGSAGGAAMKPPKPLSELTSEELRLWKSKNLNPDSEKSDQTQYANWYNASVQADPHSAELQAQGAAPYSAGTPPALRQSPQGAGNLPAASAASTGQPSAQGGGQGPLQYMMGLGKKFKENYADFEEGWKKDAIAGGYIDDDSKPDEPWNVKNVGDEDWHSRKKGILIAKDDPDKLQKAAKMATGEDGNLDQERYNQILKYIDQEGNPYQEIHEEDRRKGYEEEYSSNPMSGIFGMAAPITNWLGKKMYGYGKHAYKKSQGTPDLVGR